MAPNWNTRTSCAQEHLSAEGKTLIWHSTRDWKLHWKGDPQIQIEQILVFGIEEEFKNTRGKEEMEGA